MGSRHSIFWRNGAREIPSGYGFLSIRILEGVTIPEHHVKWDSYSSSPSKRDLDCFKKNTMNNRSKSKR